MAAAVTFEKFESPSTTTLYHHQPSQAVPSWYWVTVQAWLVQLCFRQNSFTFHLEFVVCIFKHVWLQLHTSKKNPSLKLTLFFSPNLQKVQNCKWQQKICEATDTSQWLEVTLNFVEICLGTVLESKNCKWRICMVEQQQLSTWMTILLKSLAKDCVLVFPCVLLLYSSFSRFTLGTCIQAPRPTKNRWESKFPARYAFS